MEFKEYLQESEYLAWERYDENRLLDILKGSYDIVKGAAQTGAGVMTVGDEALAKIVGDGQKGRMKRGFQGIKKGILGAGGGLKKIVVGGEKNKKTKKQLNPTATTKTVQKSTSSPLWQKLVSQYATAKTQKEKREIQSKMAQVDPVVYQQTLKAAQPRKPRPSTDPSGRLRSGGFRKGLI